MYITNKSSLDSMYFSEHERLSFICVCKRIYRQFNSQLVARPARRDPAEVGARRSRQAEALYATGRTAPLCCPCVTALGHQCMKSYLFIKTQIDSDWQID